MWFMISGAQLEQYLDEDRVIWLVDLRDREDYRQGHIRGAVNIPYEELWDRVEELPTDQLLVFYCYRGPRSMMAARKLARRGYQAADVCGGMEAYRGKHMVRGEQNYR